MNTGHAKPDASTKKRGIVKGLALVAIVGSVLAAAVFIPNNQPWGYVASPTLNSARLKTGNVVAYTPWFEVGTFRGDLMALPVAADGTVGFLSPKWRGGNRIDAQDPLLGRNIVTVLDDGSETAVPFRISSLTGTMVSKLNTSLGTTSDLLNYIRGDRSQEYLANWRNRSSALGDIVHSNPVFVGKPRRGYVFGDYPAFAIANKDRAERVYVGANDGMLHAFDAETGREVFAYIPSMVWDELWELAQAPYTHHYYVDGPLTSEDVQYDGSWHTLLVGGLGAGGRGYFALDVTDPAVASETDAAAKILWEFKESSTGAENLGYSYGRPSLVRLDKSGTWGVVLANGYLSYTGKASLYILNPKTGAVIKELVVSDDNANGLSSPTVIDSDGDGIADTVYAGDLNGNLWKFELGPDGPDTWQVGLSGSPLFTTSAGQPITTAPDVGYHPLEKGNMVYFGTGQLFSLADGNNKTTQAVYGIWDTDAPVAMGSLLNQQLTHVFHASGEATRVASNRPIDWSTHKGWRTPTQISNATSLDLGERVLQDVTLRDGRVSFLSVNPSIATGENWLIQLDAYTGGAPDQTILDINEDDQLTIADNVDTDGDTVVEDIPTERVVGQYQEFGLASKPVYGIIDNYNDTALINHLSAVSPNAVFDSTDPGLVGGHFDLDTSSQIYGFGAGDTDGHVHEWDDKWDSQTIDYMNLPDTGKLFNIDHGGKGVGSSDVFFITVANTHLSPGGRLEINSSSVSVVDYHDLVNRYLSGNLRPGEVLPRFKIDAPTPSQAAAGVLQLDSLKLSFDAYTLVSGGLIPTQTGCVRGNDRGQYGEYRNGALLVQAVNADNLSSGIVYDAGTDEYDINSASTSINAEFGHATRGLLWESSVFWHWDNDCYGEGDWEINYAVCIIGGDGSCLEDVTNEEIDKGEKKKDKDKDKDTDGGTDSGSGGTTGTGSESDPGHNVTNTTTKGTNSSGRLFWRELVPQE